MIARLRAWWEGRRKPYVCPDCNLRCKSKTGLGRHRAAEKRAKDADALKQQGALPLPAPLGSCPVESSITGAGCLLPAGHEAHDASRFHRYPPPEGALELGGAEIDCVNPFHLRNGHHDRATCYTTRTPPEEK